MSAIGKTIYDHGGTALSALAIGGSSAALLVGGYKTIRAQKQVTRNMLEET